MVRSVSATVNSVLGRFLPEQRLFSKTDKRTRFVRISPVVQFSAGIVVVALIGWSGIVSYHQFVSTDHDAKLLDVDGNLVSIYENRIVRLEDEKRRLADRLSLAHLELAAAADEVADAHQSLGDALVAKGSLNVMVSSYRDQIEDLAALNTKNENRNEILNAELSKAKTGLSRLSQQNSEAEAALTDLADALVATAESRNIISVSATQLAEENSTLQAALDVGRDQQSRLVSRLEDAARLSLGSLETVFSKSGVDLEKVLTAARRDYSGAGGLFRPMEDDVRFDDQTNAGDRVNQLFSNMERINALRVAFNQLPFSRPVGAARFTSGYGGRKDPINGRRSFHAGIDLAAPRGTAIYAAGAGEVVFSARQRGYGNLIKIRHAFGYETVYAHLNRRRVNVGDIVERGDRIGDMGNTGRSTGTHLHYEIRVNGKTVNPAKYIEAARNVL